MSDREGGSFRSPVSLFLLQDKLGLRVICAEVLHVGSILGVG